MQPEFVIRAGFAIINDRRAEAVIADSVDSCLSDDNRRAAVARRSFDNRKRIHRIAFNYNIAGGAMFDKHHLSLRIAVFQVFDVEAEFRKNAVTAASIEAAVLD